VHPDKDFAALLKSGFFLPLRQGVPPITHHPYYVSSGKSTFRRAERDPRRISFFPASFFNIFVSATNEIQILKYQKILPYEKPRSESNENQIQT
jgi:hypothetical protein